MIRRLLFAVILLLPTVMFSQAKSDATIPRVIRFSGTLPSHSNEDAAIAGVTFALYAQQEGGSPLWLETQNISVDAGRHYSVLLGSATKDGLPLDVFTANEARWLGVKVEGQNELPRVLLVSVPYALKASDAETLGGYPLSAFVMTQSTSSKVSSNISTAMARSATLFGASANSVLNTTPSANGTTNFIAKFDAGSNLINSSLFDNGNIGIGTTNPLARLQVDGVAGEAFRMTGTGTSPSALRLTNTGGDSYFGVEGATAGGYFPNSLALSTVIYSPSKPIQNIIGTASRLTIQSNGNVGIGTSNPAAKLQVDGAVGEAFRMTATGTNPSTLRLLNSNADAYFGVEGATAGGYFTDSLPYSTVFYSPGQPLQYIVNGASRLTIQTNGNVGVGTKTPNSRLSVAGTVESTSGGFKFPDGSVLASASSPTVTSSVTYTGTTTDQVLKAIQNQTGDPNSFQSSGVPSALRGDSTATSGYAAGVFGSASSIWAPGVAGVNLSQCDPGDTGNPPICKSYGVFGWSVQARRGAGVWGQADATVGDNVGVFGTAAGDQGTGVEGFASCDPNLPALPCHSSGDGTGVYGVSDAFNGNGVWGFATASTGNTVGIYGQVVSTAGIAGQFDAPTNGTILVGRNSSTGPTKVFRVDSAGKGYFNGGTQTGGADFAESVDVSGGAALYQPGDVLMIDNTGNRRLALAAGAYSTKVAGIYSTKPGVLATPHEMDDPRLATEVPLAIVGIVPCKVTAENGAIHAGDLLVTSTHPGFAMKGTDRKKMLGAVVGKALGSLDKGTGTIEVLVSLH